MNLNNIWAYHLTLKLENVPYLSLALCPPDVAFCYVGQAVIRHLSSVISTATYDVKLHDLQLFN